MKLQGFGSGAAMYMDWDADSPGKSSWGEDEADVGEVLVYNPSGLNMATLVHFAELQPPLPIAIGGRLMSPKLCACPAHIDDSYTHTTNTQTHTHTDTPTHTDLIICTDLRV